MCYNIYFRAGRNTESYALLISIAHKMAGSFAEVHASIEATMVAIAVAVLRPGQKLCWSRENNVGIR